MIYYCYCYLLLKLSSSSKAVVKSLPVVLFSFLNGTDSLSIVRFALRALFSLSIVSFWLLSSSLASLSL